MLQGLKPVITTWSTRAELSLSSIHLQIKTPKYGSLLVCQNSHHTHQTSRQVGEDTLGWTELPRYRSLMLFWLLWDILPDL